MPEPTATPLPVLPAPDVGDAVRAYTRPWDPRWLELAMNQGRWLVALAGSCSSVGGWQNVMLTTQPSGEVHVNDCGIVSAIWSSDASCAIDGLGLCDVQSDASYLDWLGQQPSADDGPHTVPPTRAAEPPTTAPHVAPVAAPPPRTLPVTHAVAPAAPPTPRVVYVTADTPTPTPRPTARPTPLPTLLPLPVFLNPATGDYQHERAVATARAPTVEPTAMMPVIATPIPTTTERAAGPVSWTVLLGMLGALILLIGGGYGIYRLNRRRYLAQLAALEPEQP